MMSPLSASPGQSQGGGLIQAIKIKDDLQDSLNTNLLNILDKEINPWFSETKIP